MLGRKDNQVKINGFRIELNEINTVLAKIDNIKECTTIVLENKNKKIICSYLVSKDGSSINENIIRDYLKQSLPYYMVPTYFIQMNSLPLTANGKIDKKALPSPIQKSNNKITLPKNAIEETLLNIFKSTLNLEEISTTDSFFELGGDSLLAIKLIIKIKEKLKVKIKVQNLFENSTICQLSDLISNSENSSNNLDILTKVEVKDFYHISSAQKRIYYSSKIAGEETILYNTPGAIIFNKKPNVQKLNECFKKLIKRHSSLRTYFEEIDEEIYQKITPSLSFELEEKEIKNKNINEIMEDFVKPFDLGKAPLFHACFVNTEDKYLLLLDMHHIICDGASLSLFTKELSDLYNDKNLSDLSSDYVDYAEWEFDGLKAGKFNENKDFWVNQFKDNIPVLDFPTDYVRPSVQSFEGAKIYKSIDRNLTEKIFDLARSLGVSPFMLMLSSYYVLLHKYSNSEDIIVGSPVANRNIPEVSDMFGMFVNTLPLKCHIEDGISFKDFLNTVKTNCISAFDNEIYPFDELVNNLNIIRDTSRNPLFDTMFIYQNEGQSNISFDGINSNVYVPNANISKFDFSLEIIPNNNGELDLNFEYCTKLFKEETAERFAEHYINTLEKIIENCDSNIEDIDILSEKEKKINKKVLYIPFRQDEDKNKYVVPQNNTQKELQSIWMDLLNNNKISIYDDFFHLGGDSLLCIKLSSRIYERFNVKLNIDKIFKYSTIATLSQAIDSLSIDSSRESIEIQPVLAFYPVSSAQQRMYLASKIDENSTLYNVYGGVLLDNMIDINKLQNAINIIVSRHDILCTYFEIENKQIVQKIAKNIDIKIEIQDVNTNDVNDLFYIYTSNFDLSKAPLFKVLLFKLPNGKALLMLDVHHIIFDGTSLNNFINELSNAYNGKELPKLDISYKDFAVWETEALENCNFKESKEFWLGKFSGDIPVLNLPTVYKRPKSKSYEGTTYKSEISKEITEKTNNFANSHNVTPFMVMLSCYYILLNKYSGDTDIIVGSPASGRLYKELEPLLGMFVNSVPLRNAILPNMSFKEFLQNVKETCLNSFEHQDYPFDVLVNDLKLKKDSSRSLLFDTMFTYQNSGIKLPQFGNLPAKYISPNCTTSKFDISLEVLPEDGKLTLSFEYCTKLFDEIFIGNFAKSYENILTSVLEKPEILIKDISIISNKENNLYNFNKIKLENKEDIGFLENKITSNVFSSFTNENSYDTISVSSNTNIEKQVANVFKQLLPVSDFGPDDNFFDLGGDSLTAINLQIELLKLNYKLTYADIFECPTIRELTNKISDNIL